LRRILSREGTEAGPKLYNTISDQRAELREMVKPGDMTVATLLGNCKPFKHTMEYIRATGRMEDRET